MQKHTKIYLNASGLNPGEPVNCEICGMPATEIHHIQRRGMGGSKTADVPENLMAVCHDCHVRYGDKVAYKRWLYLMHSVVMETWPENINQKQHE